MSGYEWLAQVRGDLARLVADMDDIAGEMNLPGRAAVADLRARVGSDEFVVLVAGEFKTGKSTTINAILGDKVLPAYATPTTAVLSVVRHGDHKAARLYELDPGASDGRSTTAKDIRVEDLADYITIDEENPGDESPWGLAEIDWPLELCRNGVTVVDSPGLNEDPVRSRVTMGYLGRADAIVFVSDATRVLSASEQEFLALHIKAQGHEDMFFLCNRINLVDDDPAEQERVRTRVRRILSHDWDAGPHRVFFVNAKAALTGRQRGDEALVAGSGIPGFERELEHFLSTGRARLKIVPPARHLQQIVAATRETIDRQIVLLDENVETLRARYDRAQEPLDRLERQRRLIVEMVGQELAAARADAEESARRMLTEAAASCEVWAKDIPLISKIGVNPLTARKQTEAVIAELSERLGARLQEHFATWHAKTLTPLLEDHLERLEEDIDDSLRHFVEGVEQVRVSFTAGSPSSPGDLGRQPSALERTVAGAAGLVLLSPGMALVGARFGFRQVLAGVGPQLGAAVLGILVGLGPAGLALLLGTAAFVQLIWGLDKVKGQLVTKVAGRIADDVRAGSADQAAKIGAEVRSALDVIRIGVDDGLGTQIATARREVEDVLDELTHDRGDAGRMKARLAGYRTRLNAVDTGAVDIIAQFATIS